MKRWNKKLLAVVLGIAIIGGFAVTEMVYSQSRSGSGKTGVVEVNKIDLKKAKEEPGILSVPLKLNYQGYLTDDGGTPVTDTVTMVFRIYDAEAGGSEKWASGNQSVDVENGIFHHILDNVPLSVFSEGLSRWLELTINGEVLSPRTEITSSAWAYSAILADTAEYARNAAADNDWVISGNDMYSGVSGNTGIGTTSPEVKFQVQGDIACTGMGLNRVLYRDSTWVFDSGWGPEDILPYWHSHGAGNPATGNLELGYLVLGNSLIFAIGGYIGSPSGKRVEVVRVSDNSVLYTEYLSVGAGETFVMFNINTSTNAGTLIKIRAIDNDSNASGAWISISPQFYVQ